MAKVGVEVIGIVFSKVKAVAIPPPPPPPSSIAVVIPKLGVLIVGVNVGITVGVSAGNNVVVNPPPGVGTPGVPPSRSAAYLV